MGSTFRLNRPFMWLVVVMLHGGMVGGRAPVAVRADVIVVGTRPDLISALNSAAPGDEVVMTPGTYGGGLFFSGLTGVTLRSQDPGNPAVIDAAGLTTGMQLSDAVDVTIRDLIIQNADVNGLNIDDGGSFATPSQNITLKNLTVRNIGSTGNHDGIKLSGVTGFHIDSVRVIDWGASGSAVDMVGSHHGLIENSLFKSDTIDLGGSGVRPKGGSKGVTIRANRFELAGGLGRAIQFGGSTDAPFFRFIDGDSGYEADGITAEGNVVLGGRAPFSFSVIDGGVYHHNYASLPGRWVVRILNENPGLVETQNGAFLDNVVLFDDGLSTHVNVGDDTLPLTYVFERNQWFNVDDPSDSTPVLPVVEVDPVHGVDPGIDPDGVIAWAFEWGVWLVNANDQANSIDLGGMNGFAQANGLFLAGALDGGAAFNPLGANPLIGSWETPPLVGGTVQLPAFSQVILVNTPVPVPSSLGVAGLGGLVVGLRSRRRGAVSS